MYAGAVREAVFANPEIVRRVNSGFVPLALRAALVNNVRGAGDREEEKLYAELKRIMLAPQGIGVLNSDGQVLEWVQMFQGEKSLCEFFDSAARRYQEFPDSAKPFETGRFLRFPDQSKPAVPNDKPFKVGGSHAAGCPSEAASEARAPRGCLAAHVIGRALDKHGALSSDTVRQEHYAQDHFVVSPEALQALASTADARRRLSEELERQIVTHAYLGHIDVRPVSNPAGGKGETESCEFWARKESGLLKIEGKSDVVQTRLTNGQGRHEVHLIWEGFASLEGERIARLVLLGRGTEILRFHNGIDGDELQRLPGGREIDLESGVVYGILGEPGAEPPRAPADPSSIEGKMRRLHEMAEERRKQGKSLEHLPPILQKFQPLMNEGKTAEASAVLDEALASLDKDGPAPRPDPDTPPAGFAVQQKMIQVMHRLQERMQAIQRLMQQGKFKEAEAAADELLKLIPE